MGQRQQSWIIAKVNGSYRVLAVVHNQWAYGTIPIKACWRLFRILENPENKRLARHELTATAAKDADWWKKQQEMAYSERDVVDAIPFQFLLTCLVLATSFDPRVDRTVSYGSRVHPLDVNTSWSQVDNNDGFTILDITDIDKPSYCFTQINRWGEHDDAAEGRVSCGTPMTDLEYLSYYPDLGNLYHPSLAAWDVINAGVLWDLWPDGDWSDRSDAGDPKDVQRTVSASEQDNVNLSLSELAFKKAVEAALDDETAEEALSSVEHIPSLPGRLARYMLGNPALVKRPCGPQLLARSLKGELAGSNGNLLDLSHWPLLGEDDILYVVKHSTLTNEVAGVDLSNNGNVSAQCVKALVHLCPRLTKIVAFNMPALSMSDLLGCMDPSRTHDIFHSDHFRAAFAADFTRGDSQSSDVNRVTTPDISAPNTLTQIFYYCDHPFYLPRDEAAQGSGDKPDSGLHWKGAVDKLEEKGSILDVRGYNQPIVRAIPLQDVILAPDSIVDWFPQVIQLALHHRNSQERLDAASICPDFSMALAVGLKDPWRVRPLPAASYMCSDIGSRDAVISRFQPVERGFWTMLVFADMALGPPSEGRVFGKLNITKVHYAFLTRAQDGDIIATDLKGFVERVVGHGVDLAVDELVSNVTSGYDGCEGGRNIEGNLTIDWSKLKSLHPEEAKDIVEKFMPVYEKAREAGIPPWLRKSG